MRSGQSKISNLPWTIDSDAVASMLGLKSARVHIINDLVATGHGLRALAPAELSALQPGTPDEEV